MLEARKLGLKKRVRLTPTQTVSWLRSAGAVGEGPWALGDYEKIKNKWYGQPCYVVGTGPTLKPFLDKFGWDFFDGKHAIGINHAIEDYDGFEWFFFLDKRFLDKTTYDMSKYKGLVIAQNTTGLKPADNQVIFKCRDDMPTDVIEDGIYSSNLSGLAALHVAVLSGANPIYLVGHGMGESDPGAYHYRDDYTGEVKDPQIWKKFYRVRTYFDNFSEWRHKIFSVSNYKEYTAIDNIPLEKFDHEKKKTINVEGRLPRIAHLSFSSDLARHATTTRYMVSNGYGVNKLLAFKDAGRWDADLYVLNHFLSTDRNVQLFTRKQKAIDIVHTRNCVPRGDDFKGVIAMSDVWRKNLIAAGVNKEKISVIPACIDFDNYQGAPEYNNKTFGRITRWSTGKIPEWWNDMLLSVFQKEPEAKCKMFVHWLDNKRKPLNHENITYDSSVFIFENKFQYLSQMAFYVHANGFFREISPHAILEAMATGLPIVYLWEESIEEMVGEAGHPCADHRELQKKIIEFLAMDPDEIARFGAISKQRAAAYDEKIMLEKYDALVKGYLNE